VALRQPFVDRGRHQEVHVAVDRAEVAHAAWVRGWCDRARRFYRLLPRRVKSDRLLGADIVVRRGDDVALRIRRHFPQGVDGLADGAVLNELVIPAVRAFTSVRGFQGIPQRDIHFTATFVRSYAQEFEKLDRLRQQVEAGKITLRVAEVYPPERAADAHRRLEAGGTRGRLVIQF
jgi:NADPH:quinone reductase